MRSFIFLSLSLALNLTGLAAPLTQAASGISGATNTLNFEEFAAPADATPITNQYSALGITFGGVFSNGTSFGTYVNVYGPNTFDGFLLGFSTNYLTNFDNGTISAIGTSNAVSIQFSTLVNAASFAFGTDADNVSLQAFNGAVLVDSATAVVVPLGQGFWGFSGGPAFDRIVVTASAVATTDAAMAFDSFAFTVGGGAPELDGSRASLPVFFALALLLARGRRTRALS